MISPLYREQNRWLHEHKPTYGAGGWQYSGKVKALIAKTAAKSLLDYGAGKGTLAEQLRRDLPGLRVQNYDPVTYIEPPRPADLVISTDVLEHVEPERLRAVLDHMAFLMLKAGFFVIATRPAKKALPDGRNAHLIQQPSDWWRQELERIWTIERWTEASGEIEVIVT